MSLPPAGPVYGKAGGETVRAPRFAKFSKVFKINPYLFLNKNNNYKNASLDDSSSTLLSAEKSSKMFCESKTAAAREMQEQNGNSEKDSMAKRDSKRTNCESRTATVKDMRK